MIIANVLHSIHHAILVWHLIFWICVGVLCAEVIFDRPILKTVRWWRGRWR